MIVYHGTTDRRARRICTEGFVPRKPSRRVWFAKSKAYARGRARTQARRAHDRAAVLTCNIDLHQMRDRLGPKRVFVRGGVIAIDAPIPATVLRSYPAGDVPASPEELSRWVNRLLGLKPYKGVPRHHPGIDRLSRWVVRRMTHLPDSPIKPGELLHMARQWLAEFFKDVRIDPQTLRVQRRVKTIEMRIEPPPAPDPREDEAMACLAAAKPKRRIRGLDILAEIADPDLFDWCAMFLEDESAAVRAAALHTMLRCDLGDPEVIGPLAACRDKRIRAAAIAALAKHSGKDAANWFARGLKDPDACVRLETAALLSRLDARRHRAVFELALNDPNPQVARIARKLTAGKGYSKPTSRAAARKASETGTAALSVDGGSRQN